MSHDLNKLSGLLLAAVEDIQKAKDRGFGFDMSEWWTNDGGTKSAPCTVCMAGAMLVTGRLDGVERSPADIMAGVSIQDLQDETWNRMQAVDSLRTGEFRSAWTSLMDSYDEGDLSDKDEAGLKAAGRVVKDYFEEVYLNDEVPGYNEFGLLVPLDVYREAARRLAVAGL